jgi:hypothetical protein
MSEHPARLRWARPCHEAWPGSDPDRAAQLVGPIAALRQTRIYRTFIDHIESSEHCYHRHDTAEWLDRAVALARD